MATGLGVCGALLKLRILSGLDSHGPQIAFALAHHDDIGTGQIQNRGWFYSARPGIHHQIQVMFPMLPQFVRIAGRLVILRQKRCGRQNRFFQVCQQRQDHRMLRNADADGLATRVKQPLGNLTRCFQNEGVAAGGQFL